MAYKATHDGIAERFPDPAVQKRREVALALVGHDDQLRRDVELAILTTARQHDANTPDLRRTLLGSGESLRLGLRYDIHDIQRVSRVQACVSDGRLGKDAKVSAGKRYGTSGRKSGNADLPWAFSEAAVRCLYANPAGLQELARVEKTPGTGKAVTVLAHP